MAFRWRAPALIVAVFLFAWWSLERATPLRVEGRFEPDGSIPYLRFAPRGAPAGTVLLVHGLNANKEFMQTTAAALADGGFDAYAIDLPGHGDSPAAFSFDASLEVVSRALDRLPAETAVLGHSLGAGLALELAAHRDLAALVLVSAPPMIVEKVRSPRVLALSGAWDAPRITAFAPELADRAGGETTWREFPDAGHSTVLFDPAKIRGIVAWLGGRPEGARTGARYGWLALLAACAVAAPLAAFKPAGKKERPPDPGPVGPELARRAAALGGTVLLLALWTPLAWLRLFATDYLVSLLLVSGLLLWLWRGRGVRVTWAGAAIGLGAAVYVILALGAVADAHWIRTTPGGAQWLRLPPLILAGLPGLLYNEQTIRLLAPGWKRWGTALLAWTLVWAAVVTGVLSLNREAAFLVLILHLIVAFWIGLWGMTGVVRRLTGDAFSAALFAAIVQGWVFAALFVTI